jgi:hypothetical protein
MAIVGSSLAPSAVAGRDFLFWLRRLFASSVTSPRWLGVSVFLFDFLVDLGGAPIAVQRWDGRNFAGFFFRCGTRCLQQAAKCDGRLPRFNMQCGGAHGNFFHERFGVRAG